MEFRILGPLEAIDEGRALELGGQKQRALLAVLLLHANEVVSSDRLIEALWEEGPPPTAQKALQVYVSQLRKLLGRERLVTRAGGYLLRVGVDELDLARFLALRAEGRLGEALSLWRGAPLGEFVYLRFAQSEIARLQELQLACREERIERDLSEGLHVELVGELEGLVEEHPLRERLRGQLMLGLYRSGRQAEALEVFQQGRRALVGELGIEPSRELRELHQAILNQDPALDLVPADAPASEPGRVALVGREAELGELVAGLDDALAGRGRLFLLVGEPGIGKSRLAEELVGQARARGVRALVGRCWEAGGAPAYWPWVQSLRAYVRETGPDALRAQLGPGAVDLAQLLPELRDLFPDLPEPPMLESESARFRLFEATTGFLRNAGQIRPIVLVLDDLHAADEPSLLLMRFLARELGDSRLLIVGACRNVDPTPSDPLTAALTELDREPATRILTLTGLDARDVARFIELVSGETPSDELTATIYDDTEGNPLFVGEIVRLLAAEGRLVGGDIRRPRLPRSVRDVIARRLRHLSDECNRVLVFASVLGREFALDTLARLADRAENDLLDTLDEAMEARVVSELPGGPGRLRFAHVLIRDTLYEGLTAARRVRLHRIVVETLEANRGTDAAELANHSIAGRDFERGLRYARSAGDHALQLLAYEEATRLYTMALDVLECSNPDDEGARCSLLLSLGEAEARAGNLAAAKHAFLGAANLARRLELSRELAHAAGGYGGRSVWARAGDDDQLVPLLEEGLAALGDDDTELRVRLLARLSGALRDEHSRARREAISREAVEVARRTGDPVALAYALDGRIAAILAPDTVADCLALSMELVDVARFIGDRERLVHGYLDAFIARVILGNIQEAEADLEVASSIADELRQPVQLWHVSGSRAMLALASGRLSDAEPLIEQAFEYGQWAQPEMSIPAFRLHRYTLSDFRGQLDEIEPAIVALAAEYPARPVFRCALAHLHARLGRLSIAGRALDDLAADKVSALPFDQEWLYGMSLLAETCALTHHMESAPILYGLLAPWSGLNAADHPEGFMGSVSRYLGQLAAQLERFDDAARHFEDALEMNERMGARPWLARTQADYARMLSASCFDRKRAEELASEARATFRELGMPML